MTIGVVNDPKTIEKAHDGANGADRTPTTLKMIDAIINVAQVVGVRMLLTSVLIFFSFPNLIDRSIAVNRSFVLTI